MRAILTAVLLGVSPVLMATPAWHWDHPFGDADKKAMTGWIEGNVRGLNALLGPFPERIHVHFRRHRGREPVPWAHTHKGRGPRVFFHVNTAYGPERFEQDWTAPHELVHLLFPYLGADSRWFAEGVASYLQYQIMHANGVLEWEAAVERIGRNFRSAGARSAPRRMSIVEQSRRGGGSYHRLYWGGATYFLHVDRQLHETRGIRLHALLRRYVDCCYQPWGIDAMGLIHTLDRLAGGMVFIDTFHRTVAREGFPETAEALDWLRRNPPEHS